MGYCVGGGGGGGGGEVLEKLGKQLKSFDRLAFHPFPTFDQLVQINTNTNTTERLNGESCLKQPEETTIQELDQNGIKQVLSF